MEQYLIDGTCNSSFKLCPSSNLILTPEIDPLTLRTGELKSVLRQNNVAFPSEAKKKELVELFWTASSEKSNQKDETRAKKELGSKASAKSARKREKHKASKAAKKAAQLKKESPGIPPEIADAPSETSDVRSESPDAPLETTTKVSGVPSPSHVSQKDGKETIEVSSKPLTLVNVDVLAKSTPKSHESSGISSSGLRKRKSMLLELGIPYSDSPSKGNIFEVESDSDNDFLSPQTKKLKTSLLVAGSPMSKSPMPKDKSPLSRDKFLATKEKPVAVTPFKTATHTPQAFSTNTERAAATPERITETHISPAKDNENSKVENFSSDTSDDISFRELSPNVLATQQLGISENDSQHSFDSAVFDKALEKLKNSKETHTDAEPRSHAKQDEELAKFLGVDLHSVKPKKKGKRVITPRRPIYVLKADLPDASSTSDDLVSDLKKDAETDLPDETINMLEKDGDIFPSTMSDDENEIEQAPKSSAFKFVFYFVLWLLVVGSLLFTYWYREQTFLVGYCGYEINRKTIQNSGDYLQILSLFGEYLDDNFKPQCIDCPQHARCFPNLEIACYDDFVPYAPWYFKYVPFFDPRTQRCVSDTKKAEKIEIMIETTLDLLRARNANKLCGRSSTEDLSAGISLEDLHDLLLSLKAPYITIEEFEELWERSVVELEKEPEIIVRQVTTFETTPSESHTNTQVGYESSEAYSSGDTNDSVGEKISKEKVLRSTALLHLSFKCLMSNTLVSILVKFQMAVFVLICIVVVIWGALWKYKQTQIHAKKIETIHKEVLSKLQRQARLARETTELLPYVGSIQLRDLILSSESNLAYKMRLWEGVSRKVDRNTNVRHELREIHGEMMKVWQWIGSLE